MWILLRKFQRNIEHYNRYFNAIQVGLNLNFGLGRSDSPKIDKDYKYAEIKAKYGGLEQRWIIVRNRESKYKELETLNKKLKKEEENFDDTFKKLKKRTFLGKTEASEYMAMKRKSHPLFKFEYSLVGVYKKIPRSKRKIKVGVRIHAKAIRNEEKIKKLENRKGKFVLATPFMDDKELSAEDILNSYRGRNKAIEGNFKVLKDRTKNLSQICLKKEERIEAMMAVMTLILMVNSLAQIKLREHLVEHEKTIPNQLGRPISNPTFAWASYILRHIVKLKIKIGDQIFHEVQGLKQEFECIIKAFGSYATSIYGLD
jgi:transposase